MKQTTIRRFQNLMRKEGGFYLNDPEPCTYGYKGGNWGAYDSTGRYWQDSHTGSDYDEIGYVRSSVRRKIWEMIANEKGFTLVDNLKNLD